MAKIISCGTWVNCTTVEKKPEKLHFHGLGTQAIIGQGHHSDQLVYRRANWVGEHYDAQV